MRKATLLFVALLSAVVPAASIAQVPQADPAVVAAMEAEGPLTQSDIDTFVRFWPGLSVSQNDAHARARVLERAGWTENRATYVTNKIMVSQPYAMGADPNDLSSMYIPAWFKPSPEEIELIKANLPAIENVLDDTAVTEED